jgi:putative effector of murein hydrolase
MNPFRLWVYLQTTPLFWLTATLAAFLVADALAKAAGRRPIVNHVLIAIALLGGLLKLTGTDYQTYFNGAQFVHFLLGPATVALGVPIYANFALVKRNVWPLAAALLIGAIVDRVGGAGRQSVRRAARRPDRARAKVDHGRRRDGRD